MYVHVSLQFQHNLNVSPYISGFISVLKLYLKLQKLQHTDEA